MSLIDAARHRLRALFRGEAARRDADDEIAFHLALDTMHAQGEGRSAEEAEAVARRRLGNVTAVNEARRSVSRLAWLDESVQDLRYAWRVLRRAPGYMAGAALTLAIGIGAATAVFSVIDAVLIRGLPYGDVQRLVWIIERSDSGAFRAPSYPTFQDWERAAPAWSGALEGIAYIRGHGTWLDGVNGAERALVGNVTPGFFRLMATAPLLGRTFAPGEEVRGAGHVAVLSYETWRRNFGGDRTVIGRKVTLDSAPTTIIGVMPRGFTYPQWVSGQAGTTGMWAPLSNIEDADVGLSKRNDHSDSRIVGRIRAGSDSARAAAALAVVEARLRGEYPAEAQAWTGASLIGIRDVTVGSVRTLLLTLGGAVVLVLLLACVNLANLSFVRGAARSRELAVRAALGAGRWRIVRQLLAESIIIATLAAAGGAALAAMLVGATRSLATDQLPRVDEIVVDRTLLGFALLLALVAAMVSAIVPALRATRGSPVSSMRSGVRTAGGGRRESRVRDALVVVQLALALVLLVGTGLLVQSFRRISDVPLGIDPDGVIQTQISPPHKYARADDAAALYASIIERLKALPGVEDAAFANGGTITTTVNLDGDDRPGDLGSSAGSYYRTVSEGYLRVMRMQMLAGRWLTADDMQARDRFVINETMARQLFHGGDAVGKRVIAHRASRARADFGAPVSGTVIGVVRDTRQNGKENLAQAEIFVPNTLEVWPWGTIVLRTRDVAATIPLARHVLLDVDPSIPEARAASAYGGFGPVADRFAGQSAQRLLVLAALGAFSVAALLLASIGMYSVVSYGVSQRTCEVGVRVALGSTEGRILRMILGEGMRLAIAGTIVGLLGAVGATRLMRAMLFGTTPTDATTYAATVAVLLGTAAVACYVPSRRAARLSPTQAIREGLSHD